jgi:ABC-type multidrug transport system fused ATPase/permease subunit
VLFNTTVKQNILFGEPDATDEDIEQALKKANAYDFLIEHADGINLHVGASGG